MCARRWSATFSPTRTVPEASPGTPAGRRRLLSPSRDLQNGAPARHRNTNESLGMLSFARFLSPRLERLYFQDISEFIILFDFFYRAIVYRMVQLFVLCEKESLGNLCYRRNKFR